MLKLVAVTGLLLGLGAPALASGATRYAEPDANGPEPCAKGDPCDLVTAVEGAAATDKVRLASGPGNYSVSVVVDIPNGTDVGGVPGKAKPVVIGTAFYVFDMDSDSSLHDIEVRTDTLHGVFAAGTLERARVRATTGGTACAAAFGLIRDSLCTNTDAGGIALGIQSGCVGPSVQEEATAVNVTAIAAAGAGVSVQTTGGCDVLVTGTNVIASGNPYDITAGADLAMGSRAEVALSYSVFDSSSAPGTNDFVTAPGTGQNITTGATFVDAASGNYRQVESSSTRNQGIASPDLGDLDLDREPRIAQGVPDIGADEYFRLPTSRSSSRRQRFWRPRSRRSR